MLAIDDGEGRDGGARGRGKDVAMSESRSGRKRDGRCESELQTLRIMQNYEHEINKRKRMGCKIPIQRTECAPGAARKSTLASVQK